MKKPIGKKLKGSVDVNFKNKRAGWLISQSVQNKMKPHADTISMIELCEVSDSEMDKFLAEEDTVSFGLCPDQPYNYVDNLPPCLKNNPESLVSIFVINLPSAWRILRPIMLFVLMQTSYSHTVMCVDLGSIDTIPMSHCYSHESSL